MEIKKGLTILFTALGIISTPISIQEKSTHKDFLKNQTEITALDFERMQGLSYWYEQKNNANILNNFITENKLFEGLEESSQTERDSLIKLVQKYSNPKTRFRNKDYKNKIYPEFIKLNKEITRKKEAHNTFSLLEFDEQNILLNKSKGKKIEKLEQKIITEYKQKIDLLKKLEVDEEYSVIARTILSSTRVLPLIKYLNNENIQENSILSIIAKESVGIKYIVGPKNEINAFQTNPNMIQALYSRLKRSNKEEDKSYQEVLNIKNTNLKDFTEKLKTDYYHATALGLYYMKEIKKESKNESHFVLLYHLGKNKFYELPPIIREKILSGSVNDMDDISDKDLKFTGIKYLKQYYSLKNRFEKVDEMLKQTNINKS